MIFKIFSTTIFEYFVKSFLIPNFVSNIIGPDDTFERNS